jgi:hypothetical protein
MVEHPIPTLDVVVEELAKTPARGQPQGPVPIQPVDEQVDVSATYFVLVRASGMDQENPLSDQWEQTRKVVTHFTHWSVGERLRRHGSEGWEPRRQYRGLDSSVQQPRDHRV